MIAIVLINSFVLLLASVDKYLMWSSTSVLAIITFSISKYFVEIKSKDLRIKKSKIVVF